MVLGEARNYSTRTACSGRPPELRAPAEGRELDEHADADDLGAELLGQLRGGFRRAPGREHVVDDEDPLPRRERVGMDLEAVLAVLEAVGHALGLARQLPGLARRHDADVELAGERRAEEEAARLDAEDLGGRIARGTDRPSPSTAAREGRRARPAAA